MSRSRGLEGVMASEISLIWNEPCCQIAQFQPNNVRGAATADEVAVGVHGVCALPLGMERDDRCE